MPSARRHTPRTGRWDRAAFDCATCSTCRAAGAPSIDSTTAPSRASSEPKLHDAAGSSRPEGTRSLGTVAIADALGVTYCREGDRWVYRLGFADRAVARYRLAVTDLAYRYHLDRLRVRTGLDPDSVAETMLSSLRSSDVYLRVGLARGWSEYPDRCYLHVTGVYTFPDYLDVECWADLALTPDELRTHRSRATPGSLPPGRVPPSDAIYSCRSAGAAGTVHRPTLFGEVDRWQTSGRSRASDTIQRRRRLDAVLCEPYDVIGATAQRAYYDADERNYIRVELGVDQAGRRPTGQSLHPRPRRASTAGSRRAR